MVKNPNKDFLSSISFSMDKTTISNNLSWSVYVIMFIVVVYDVKVSPFVSTLAYLQVLYLNKLCQTYNLAHTWRLLEYIPSERNYYSSK